MSDNATRPDQSDIPGRPAKDADLFAVWEFATGLLGGPHGDRWADMFSPWGVMEMPFAPLDFPLPRRIEGREEIRRMMLPVQQRAFADRTVEVDVHAAHRVSPRVIIVEFTTHIQAPSGASYSVPYVHVMHIVDGEIVRLRDYAPFHLMPPGDGVSDTPRGTASGR